MPLNPDNVAELDYLADPWEFWWRWEINREEMLQMYHELALLYAYLGVPELVERHIETLAEIGPIVEY